MDLHTPIVSEMRIPPEIRNIKRFPIYLICRCRIRRILGRDQFIIMTVGSGHFLRAKLWLRDKRSPRMISQKITRLFSVKDRDFISGNVEYQSIISGVGRILVRGGGHLATKRLSRAPRRGSGGEGPPDGSEV